MATDAWKDQFRMNEETIANWLRLPPKVTRYAHSSEDDQEDLSKCDCSAEVTVEELHRNGGVCDSCAIGKTKENK